MQDRTRDEWSRYLVAGALGVGSLALARSALRLTLAKPNRIDASVTVEQGVAGPTIVVTGGERGGDDFNLHGYARWTRIVFRLADRTTRRDYRLSRIEVFAAGTIPPKSQPAPALVFIKDPPDDEDRRLVLRSANEEDADYEYTLHLVPRRTGVPPVEELDPTIKNRVGFIPPGWLRSLLRL